jgi:tRNA U38,U39,U40 pseudouridine synthase TruA
MKQSKHLSSSHQRSLRCSSRHPLSLRAASDSLLLRAADAAAAERFGRLLRLFEGTHSYHNFISMKGRELRETRKQVTLHFRGHPNCS